MNIESVSIIAALCVMQLFLMRQVQKLIDKIMSRNYTEYAQTNGLLKPITKASRENGEIIQNDTDINIMQEYS